MEPELQTTRDRDESLKNLTMVVYGLEALSFLAGITAIIGVIINYVKRDDVRGTVFESHFEWQIRTFWWSLAGGILGWLTFLILIGFVIWFATAIWVIYRIVKGWLALNDGKAVS